MALYPSSASPGPWQSFVKRLDIINLPPSEQRKKYLTEQLQFDDFVSQQKYIQSSALNSLNNQFNQGGNIVGNKVTLVEFNGTFIVDQNSSSTVYVDFKLPVQVVGGTPFINVINGQQGGGTVTPVKYDYYSSLSPTRLQFIHSHPINAGGVDVDVISVGADLVSGGTVVQPTAAIAGDYLNVAYTTDSVAGTGVNFTAVIDGGQQLVELNATTAGSGYKVGDVFTFDSDAVGAGSTGGSVTIAAVDLTGDILTLAGTSINENGGEIYTVGNNVNVQLNLNYTSTDTLTATLS